MTGQEFVVEWTVFLWVPYPQGEWTENHKLDIISQSVEVRKSRMDNRSSRWTVQGQLQNGKDLVVCSGASTMELVSQGGTMLQTGRSRVR
jgi:hypothetical protein